MKQAYQKIASIAGKWKPKQEAIDKGLEMVKEVTKEITSETFQNIGVNPNKSPYSDIKITAGKKDEVDIKITAGNKDEVNSTTAEEEPLQETIKKPDPVRVHDVIFNGNEKNKDHVVEAEEDVVERKRTITREIRYFTKPDPVARSSSLEGSLKYKNIFGYGDIMDGSLAYGCDHSAEVGLGMYLPRFRGRPTPFMSRVYLSIQDWLKYSSYKERAVGLSLGLIASKYHELAYNIAWRNLIDPSQMASRSIRRQLGHSLVSALKYTFKVDKRNSSLRPTREYSFISTSQIGGLAPDSGTFRFLRQIIDLRYAVPVGCYRAALNFGMAA
ncbi:unnamed protein product [Arabidopsis lyrata]|uniref:uncharacterized protein LOC110225236 n=1 Tax=Arabidopsis lyrata subsp. lyrata TaxID=81972 RepID=UPI000A29A42E|nr:uncharacterized protein LOC110225236 [Arabidopsis lyrata subsp. lyrata]CAH8253307.1 unnamed protein product [Arabidopsis lyrata]|eukprot:XP_020870101.1 uncharacterized protein LOC110225236 [Arabidopsis lyrata subsp. lyrata]